MTVAVPDPIVRFSGGPAPYWNLPVPQQVVYRPPRNTMDPRYRTCTQHRVACDCREAELAEQLNELRMDRELLKSFLDEILAGHPTYDPDSYELDGGRVCQCTGCQIVRAIHYYPEGCWGR